YWDANGTDPGFFTAGSFADGGWDTDAVAANQRWTTDVTGVTAPVVWNDAASPFDNAIFQVLGANGTNTPGNLTSEDAIVTVTATETRNVGTWTVDNGWVALTSSGTISATNGMTINNNGYVTATVSPNNLTGFSGVINTGTATLLINSGGRL